MKSPYKKHFHSGSSTYSGEELHEVLDERSVREWGHLVRHLDRATRDGGRANGVANEVANDEQLRIESISEFAIAIAANL